MEPVSASPKSSCIYLHKDQPFNVKGQFLSSLVKSKERQECLLFSVFVMHGRQLRAFRNLFRSKFPSERTMIKVSEKVEFNICH